MDAKENGEDKGESTLKKLRHLFSSFKGRRCCTSVRNKGIITVALIAEADND